MTEYRLNDLARASGVSARNIRAYRERGLLDPPRRVGRSAFYDDYHLSQLETINQLLRRGFNSSHIAEFFAAIRQGADLADILGIQRAILDSRSDGPVAPIDAQSDEAGALVEHGLAEIVDGGIVFTDATMAAIVARAADPMRYVRVVLQMAEATRESIDALAADFVLALEKLFTEQFGADYVPKPAEMTELSRVVLDYRDLGNTVILNRIDRAIRSQMVTAVSEYTAGILLRGE